MRILIVEDSLALATALQRGLVKEGFAVDVAHDGERGLLLARSDPYDAVVLDLQVPRVDGWSVLARLREKRDSPPVLILTARDALEDRVRGLNSGADDYLTKPCAFEEFLARIHALVRRRYADRSPGVRVGELELDPAARRVSWAGRPLELGRREYALLEYLVRRRGETVTREEIEDHLYGVDELPESNAVDSAVCILRSKLGPEGRALIRTKRGQGYSLQPPQVA